MLAAVSGCAPLAIGSVGSLAGLTTTAVSAGGGAFRLGKLHASEMMPDEAVKHAVRHAADELDLRCTHDREAGEGVWRFVFKDERDETIRARVDRRTANLTALLIDVGWFGSEATARLFLTRIHTRLYNLPEPGRERS